MDGTANYWGAGDTSFALPVAGDSAEEHAVQQVLDQERPPLTYAQWLNAGTPVGNFWVIDQDTGWAYWANFLAGGAATSFLVDSKLPQGALADIEGDWSYQLHVIGQFASEGDISQFWESDDAAGLSTEHGERVIEEILDAQTPAP
ncbi:hypothetical protein [uncultured Lactococcus sp.]|uniref:hypothetical protein n=1 Tax=uncultured Lactococcus sp. TaxID=167973 RepID=UPI0027DB32B1|nr:hypothetical protein [uncultured Lactococcus sp.]